MDLQDIKDFFYEYGILFALAGIALIPTIIYWSFAGTAIAEWYPIRTLAINTVFKGTVGIIGGIGIGFLMNKKFG